MRFSRASHHSTDIVDNILYHLFLSLIKKELYVYLYVIMEILYSIFFYQMVTKLGVLY